ncbi:MAG: glycosyltransferase [Acidobacteriota bacterium]|nr:glycosyltransferase [Acidobacteriota bacterium]
MSRSSSSASASGPPDLSVVLVHYRTPELVPPAVAAVRRDLQASQLEAEILLVDNDSQPGDREGFEGLGVQVLGPGTNRGFAAGVNRGFEAASADRLVVMNPDVEVRAGCLGRLAQALDAGAAAAGPRFTWDAQDRLLLPPQEPRSRTWELAAALARRGPGWSRWARRRWRRHARRHWSAREPMETFALSGALLAIRREAWDRVGTFDDGFRLYFEETDWLLRLRDAGLNAVLVPEAVARHRYNLSAAVEPRAPQWFADSAQRFRRRYYGSWFTGLLARLETPPRRPEASPQAPLGADGNTPGDSMLPKLELHPRARWVEVSPLAVGFPAAAEPVSPKVADDGGGVWQLPSSVWQDLAPGNYCLRSVSEAGEELQERQFSKNSEGKAAGGSAHAAD